MLCKVTYGLFGWGGFGPRDLDLRAQIQIFCLDDLKSFGFGFGPNPSWISKAQIHGFQMTCIARNLGNPPPRSVPLARASLTQSHSRQLSGFQVCLCLSHFASLCLSHFTSLFSHFAILVFLPTIPQGQN
jgi:hypothetical protein